MPQELLRDVLRTGDASHRQRHWSVLPLTIAGHALVVTAIVIAPLGADVDAPPISSPLKVASFMRTMAPPSPPPPSDPAHVPRPNTGAPIEAPPTIVPEREPVPDAVSVVPGALEIIGGTTPTVGVGALTGPPPPPPTPPPQPRLVRAGQGVRQPRKILHVAPEYPEMAKRARVEGTVILEAVLDVAGRVEQVRLLRSVALLDDAAIKAVQQWRYTATELNGVPVPVLMTITVTFSLR